MKLDAATYFLKNEVIHFLFHASTHPPPHIECLTKVLGLSRYHGFRCFFIAQTLVEQEECMYISRLAQLIYQH